MSKLYHIARAGQEIGRYVLADLERAFRQGEVRATDHCWTEGMAGWAPVSSVLGVSAPSAPPSMPPTQSLGVDDLGQVVCTRCRQRSYPRVFVDSSFMPRGSASYWILIVLFFPISLIYYFHIEQKYAESKRCASCGGDSLVPASSPAARNLIG